MKKHVFTTLLLISLSLNFTNAQEPNPESFFPSHVGNIWQYYGAANLWQDWTILRDSIASDGYRYLFIDFPRYNQQFWWYRLDSAFNVYQNPDFWTDNIYRTNVDSGDVWVRGFTEGDAYYGWVYDTMEAVVFGKETIIKVIKAGPFHPDSGGTEFWDTEQYFASGFGVIYHKEEPYGEVFLSGCIIDGDTFGIVTSVESISYELPKSFVLKQNYPNPFNPSTTIEFSVPTEAYIRLNIYDLLGREIRVLINERRSAGTYKVSFDGSNLSSGLYLARLQVTGNTKTIKMLLTK